MEIQFEMIVTITGEGHEDEHVNMMVWPFVPVAGMVFTIHNHIDLTISEVRLNSSFNSGTIRFNYLDLSHLSQEEVKTTVDGFEKHGWHSQLGEHFEVRGLLE